MIESRGRGGLRGLVPRAWLACTLSNRHWCLHHTSAGSQISRPPLGHIIIEDRKLKSLVLGILVQIVGGEGKKPVDNSPSSAHKTDQGE